MSEIKVACPECQQHIECDAGYSGMEISCPTCGRKMTVPQLAPMQVTTVACPGCGGALPAESILCTSCGFNLRTGQATQSAAPDKRAPAGKKKRKKPGRTRDSAELAWYKPPNTYVIAFGVVLAGLFLVGRSNAWVLVAFAGLGLLYTLGTSLTVLIHAFKKEGIGQGFLCLCIPFYILYYVFGRSDSPLLKAMFVLYLLIQVGFYIILKTPIEGATP